MVVCWKVDIETFSWTDWSPSVNSSSRILATDWKTCIWFRAYKISQMVPREPSCHRGPIIKMNKGEVKRYNRSVGRVYTPRFQHLYTTNMSRASLSRTWHTSEEFKQNSRRLDNNTSEASLSRTWETSEKFKQNFRSGCVSVIVIFMR